MIILSSHITDSAFLMSSIFEKLLLLKRFSKALEIYAVVYSNTVAIECLLDNR